MGQVFLMPDGYALTLIVDEVLAIYDCPQLVTVRGGDMLVIAVLVPGERAEDDDLWFGAHISESALAAVKAGWKARPARTAPLRAAFSGWRQGPALLAENTWASEGTPMVFRPLAHDPPLHWLPDGDGPA